jgi:hypothetical protein
MKPGGDIFLWASAIAYACLWAGLMARRRRSAHVQWILAGVGLDLAIVLGLELSRQAVGTVASGKMSPALLAHVCASTLAILFYLGAGVLGAVFVLREQKGRTTIWHRRAGWAAMTARSVGFATMLAASEVSLRAALPLVALPALGAILSWTHHRDRRPRWPWGLELIPNGGPEERRS